MDSEYDRKFEEMKKYIPFLESMIKRLESTGSTSSNPRQAQLDKIRSLRDLLLDKKKRMKMENLLKCEQVLVNLYAKVEQRETLPGIQKQSEPIYEANTPKDKSEFENIRNKLKTVTIKRQEIPDTLPEIERASKSLELCTPGSKEPALFQRRPNKNSISPSRQSLTEERKSPVPTSKRNYTRVLVSPERTSTRWSSSEKSSPTTPLYSRRSPRRSRSRRRSPSYHKRERKKSKSSQKQKDLNITLKVPEESLSSLNTKDILSRIINCSDSDVDIDTLRELRSQILGELKQTGQSEDISDLILKSYKKKTSNTKSKSEVEEGELSDSESEAIESIYGSLVIVEKDQNTSSSTKTTNDKEQPRKIQICLVINSDKDASGATISDKDTKTDSLKIDDTDFKMYDQNKISDKDLEKKDKDSVTLETKETTEPKVENPLTLNDETKQDKIEEEKSKQEEIKEEKTKKTSGHDLIDKEQNLNENNLKEDLFQSQKDTNLDAPNKTTYTPNFYKPISEQHKTDKVSEKESDIETNDNTTNQQQSPSLKLSESVSTFQDPPIITKQMRDSTEIPLLNEPTEVKPVNQKDVVSQIDILQALKNEILGESASIPGTDIVTPPLHQPKITKVANSKELLPKKKISIEKYKEKAVTSSKTSLLLKDPNISLTKDEHSKKQSLKLTEKECERFNFSKIALDDDENSDSDDKEEKDMSMSEIYDDLAPKSPDHDDFSENIAIPKPPVIIPVDPINVKNPEVTLKRDIDMRSIPSSRNIKTFTQSTVNDESSNCVKDSKREDPRSRKDSIPFISSSPNEVTIASRSFPIINHPNLTPNSRPYEMTPTHTSFDKESLTKPHVYTPMFSYNPSDSREQSVNREKSRSRWENHDSRDSNKNWEDRDPRSSSFQREPATDYQRSRYHNSRNERYSVDRRDDYSYNRLESSKTQSFGRSDRATTPSHSFGRLEGSMNQFGLLEHPSTPKHPFGMSDRPVTPSHPFGRTDCPPTPSHSFGRADCPPTPSHSFGRSECPRTPVHPFGRSDGPQTSSHQYGRLDCPPTPSHGFGRMDCPSTPSYSFGRTDCPSTPSHPFGRSDFPKNQPAERSFINDPRLRRNTDYDSNSMDERDHYKDRNSYGSHKRSYGRSESYRNFERERSVGRSEGNSSYRNLDQGGHYNKDRGFRRESSISDSSYIENDNRSYNRDRSRARSRSRFDNENAREYEDKIRCDTNTLTIKPHVGRSFTIDTSVNSTFQNMFDSNKEANKSSFDARRQRAASVGRVLVREPSVTKKVPNTETDSSSYNKSRSSNFKRSSSVGRDIGKDTSEKSFSEIKEYFKSHDFSYIDKTKNTDINKPESNKTQTKKLNETSRLPRSNKREFHDSHQVKGTDKNNRPYSPRKNCRDPRLNRSQHNPQNRHKDGEKNNSGDRKQHGLIYSNDNIARGTILGSGYGVKNYKIPKIKRPPEEKEENDKTSVDKDESPKEKEKEKVVQDNKEKQSSNNSDKNIESKKTRSKSKTTLVENKTSKKENTQNKRKSKRSIIYDSESESEEITQNDSNIKKKPEKTVPPSNKNTTSKEIRDLELLLSSDVNNVDENDDFTLDEIDTFNDNIASDSVIDNINALIEDLDNDLKTPNCNSEKPISMNTPSQIDNSQVVKTNTSIEKPLTDKEDLEKTDPNKVAQTFIENDCTHNKTDNKSNVLPTEKLDKVYITTDTKTNETSQSNKDVINEGIVSTTDEEQTNLAEEVTKETSSTKNDSCSTPDSTNSSEQICLSQQESLPDSTNEMQGEMNSDITSTHDSSDKPSESVPATSSSKSTLPDSVDSVGSLLSILQDKSKIKELLHMLGEQSSANEKIKKKLEKLSEIVSDDEDGQNDVNENKETDNKDQSETITEDNTHSKDNPVEDTTNTEKVMPLNDETMTEAEDSMKDTSVEDTKHGNEEIENELDTPNKTSDAASPENLQKEKKSMPKRRRFIKRRKGKINKTASAALEEKRVTRSEAANSVTQKLLQKKPSRELRKLQEDIKEMGLNDDILNSSGIRMCRLAKLVDEKSSNEKQEPRGNDERPVVVLEKFNSENNDSAASEKKSKPKPKKSKEVINETKNESTLPKYKPGPKSKTKVIQNDEDVDPYAFETDSVNESVSVKTDENKIDSSDSEASSLASSKSFGSSELLVDFKKKPKRKRRGWQWQSGIIKPRKRKVEIKPTESVVNDDSLIPPKPTNLPDAQCFTDKNYCFRKNVDNYSCRLCVYEGKDIVTHYKYRHPHSEIPLSRMSPAAAKEAIEQCEEINFQAICKMSTNKYVCRFCYLEFSRKKEVLEAFFWHVVSMHTGEYKRNCSECVNVYSCPFNLDIPPPPKDVKGQLIGYICGKCNFTQISLENLKTHVIVRHNDEQTEVYTINLAVMTRKTINALLKHGNTSEAPRVLRSKRNHSLQEAVSDDQSDVTDSSDHVAGSESNMSPQSSPAKTISPAIKSSPSTQQIKSKITFENDDTLEMENTPSTEDINEVTVKVEKEESKVNEEVPMNEFSDPPEEENTQVCNTTEQEITQDDVCSDVIMTPHFKLNFTTTGNKEYVCCINGSYHYKTTLLISMRKHVQSKHSEKWDGYCCLCKVIVTPQGAQCFKDCLQHYLDKHMDDIPLLEPEVQPPEPEAPKETVVEESAPTNRVSTPKPYINVRPLSELLSQNTPQFEEANALPLPKIQSVVSLGAMTVEPPHQSPVPTNSELEQAPAEQEYKYEEAQSEVMSQKNSVVLEAMLIPSKLVQVFKCAANFCSYTTDKVDQALLHVSTHKRVGGLNALRCSYCDYDCSGNAVDLVTHVFKNHGICQYVCGKCFYRAAASQLVGAHVLRSHPSTPTQGCVFRSLFVPPGVTNDSHKMLTREQAVAHYVCANADADSSMCKFRTYTAGKFCEHLLQRHSHAESYLCNYCSESSANPPDLVIHLKSHGLRLYQCTWCVFAADNEAVMLLHSSEKHPHRQPQAYLRIITNKEGGSELRVLPLAYLNKSKVPTNDIIAEDSENPVKAAERSIELETLISSTSVPTVPPTPATPPPIEIPQTAPTTQEPTPNTPVLQTIILEQTLKKEQKEAKDSGDVAFWTNSQKEQPSSSAVIDITDDDDTPAPTETQSNQSVSQDKIPIDQIMRCAKCKITFKNATRANGFKRHLKSCFGKNATSFPCAFCSTSTNTVDDLVSHYIIMHSNQENPYICGICDKRLPLLCQIRKHMRDAHNVDQLLIATKTHKNEHTFLVTDLPKPRGVRKRKLSVTAPDTAKMKRYGPEDIEKLPINPILEELVHCSLCEFKTKVRTNMVRHLQQHEKQQPVAVSVPVNPVPHLQTNEFHFDKMTNLASSSILTKTPDKTATARAETVPTILRLISPEAASCYPKYVPDRQRLTCGAIGCSYISVDVNMFKCHWETLHSETKQYHCVHCPPNQTLDTSRPLTAFRIIGHLKMHDATLYACSHCTYYHFQKALVEKHLNEVHKNQGQVMVVREEVPREGPSPAAPPASGAPTMDLKPWQCGLCSFKSMLRPEVVEHCAKMHQSKMQFKCSHCPFRASTMENVFKHQANAHCDRSEEIFHFYYREGSIRDDPDGTPLWKKQSEKCAVDLEVKTELPEEHAASNAPTKPLVPLALPVVDLNLVKKEVIEPEYNESSNSTADSYGEFCEPSGVKFKCPLCKIVTEEAREAMQSHLFEELKYRKWACGICSYKAFHKTGLNDHMVSEHRGQKQQPVELPLDVKIEMWVAQLLDYQAKGIAKNQQKKSSEANRPEDVPSTSTQETSDESSTGIEKTSMKELEQAFGPFGVPSNMSFCCPKCDTKIKQEGAMKDHLEGELTRIRWCCSQCSDKFQNYHEAQFHCKSKHAGQSARPTEAMRDPALRAEWVAAVLKVQKLCMKCMPVTETPTETQPPSEKNTAESTDAFDNSLLVVRYEERVPTPEEQAPPHRKRPTPAPDSDDERLIIDEEGTAKKKPSTEAHSCPYCSYKSPFKHVLDTHMLRHFNLKPYSCPYCDFSGYRDSAQHHLQSMHPDQPKKLKKNEIPAGQPPLTIEFGPKIMKKKVPEKPNIEDDKLTGQPPLIAEFGPKSMKKKMSEKSYIEDDKLTCLICEKTFKDAKAATHTHRGIEPQFARKGDIVVKCCICLALRTVLPLMQEHHAASHPGVAMNYAFFKFQCNNRDIHYCEHCNSSFTYVRDLRTHHNAVHSNLPLSYTTKPFDTNAPATSVDLTEETSSTKRSSEDTSILPAVKRVAKKSTTKLPKMKAVARKSTTKLPYKDSSDSDEEEVYSYYGTQPPSASEYANVTTLMPFFNSMVPFTLKKLSGIINIDPKLILKDIKK